MAQKSMTTRRAFLHRGLTLVGAATTVPVFMERSAWALASADGALTSSKPGMPDDRVLVVVQLAGGNDGLNTVIPYRNDAYYAQRSTLAIEQQDALRINDAYAFHPSLSGFKSLYDDGLLGIVHGTGYPNPNRSHFKSMDIWHSASPDGRLKDGWLGRYFDNACGGVDPCSPESGIALMNEMPLALRGRAFLPVSFQKPEYLTWRGGENERDDRKAAMRNQRGGRTRGGNRMQSNGSQNFNEAFEQLNAPEDGSESMTELDYLQRTAMDARVSAGEIRRAAGGESRVDYPVSQLSASLQTVARMIAAEMPTKIYYVSQGGYDTHSTQANRHSQLLQQLGGALAAFMRDLKGSGQADRVVVMTFSEFGRRVQQNASGGTDHGEAAPMFLMGKSVQPGFHGTPCSLADSKLHRGDLAWTTDFRRVYAALIQDWMGGDSAKLLGEAFKPLPVIKTA